ncbi:MAG: hypothetical protein Q8S13_04500 [Dehalococcoidia bacterium]|nr:hypothetical protein [Dehalococcoidia bacterium]
MDPRDMMVLEEMAAGRGSIDQHVIARVLLNTRRELGKLTARVTGLETPAPPTLEPLAKDPGLPGPTTPTPQAP